MAEREKVLSERLQMLARMVTPGSRVADVGCDHGFLSIYLVQKGISPAVIAMDVRKGPLSAAREHIEARGLNTYIETRLSDGLQRLKPGEVDTVICAGMGGRLMERILKDSLEKTSRLGELILQPQSEIGEFRRFLHEYGFEVTKEDMVREDGKYYFAMRAVPGDAIVAAGPGMPMAPSAGGQGFAADDLRVCEKYGERLILEKHPLLKEYLLWQEGVLLQLAESLRAQATERVEVRLQEIQEELEDVQRALEMIKNT